MIIVKDWKLANGDTVEVFRSGTQYRWHVQAANGEIVEQGEGHPSLHGAVEAAERHHPAVASEA